MHQNVSLEMEENSFLHQKLESFARESQEGQKFSEVVRALILENQALKAQNTHLKQQLKSQDIMTSINKVHEALKSRYFQMDQLVCNPGLEHLALMIFSYVDVKSLAQCRAVSKSWTDCIDSSRLWWTKRLHYLIQENLNPFLTEFPTFWDVFEHFNNANTAKLRKFVELFQGICDEGGLRLGHLSPLHLAADEGHLEFLTLILETPIDFELRDRYNNWTPLYFACQAGQTEVVKFLYQHSVEKKINFQSRWFDERTPLHCACKEGHLETVKFLLEIAEEKGINVKAVDERLCTPFNYACMSGNPQLVELLFQSSLNFDINATDIDGRTALHKVCRSRLPEENPRKFNLKRLINVYQCIGTCTDTRLLELFIKYSHKVNFNALEQNANNALHIVCENGCLAKIKLLFQNARKIGIDVNALNDEEMTPLHVACVMDNEKHLANVCDEDCPAVIEAILKYSENTGIDLNTPLDRHMGNSERSLLHLLCLIGCAPKVRKFLELGIPLGLNTNAEDHYFQTPRQYALKHRRMSIAQVLDDFYIK